MIEIILIAVLALMGTAVAVSEWQRSRGLPPLLDRTEPTGAEYEYTDD